MSQADESVKQPYPGKALVKFDDSRGNVEWADLRSAASWVRQRRIMFGALALIVAQLIWKAQFLGHLYFRQDDFHDLDLAFEHPLNWRYLTFVGSGHLIIGLRVIAWVMVRVSGTYNWGLASAVSLVFVACAGLAAARLLRDLFGNRPAILIPLAFYLLTALTLPDLGIWSSAMESVPLQLAIFMSLSAHLRYVRTGHGRHLAAAVSWVAFGLIFFEKGLVVPLLLFAMTALFLTDSKTVLAGSIQTLTRYWKAWSIYAALMVGYLVLLAVALRTSASLPQAPVSVGGAMTFIWELLRDTLLPGVLGGPWQWYPVPGGSFAFSAPPATLVALSVLVAAVVVAASIWLRPVAWRAWAILAGWIAFADMLPVVIGRINAFDPSVLGLETRYLADATPVVAICIGLAFWPLTPGLRTYPEAPARSKEQVAAAQVLRSAAAAMVGIFVFGSLWSVQAYENVTSGSEAATYIANAGQALKLALRGTQVVRRPMPSNIVAGTFEAYAYTSRVLGDMARGKLAGKLRWIDRPDGTIDGLMVFGADGRLHEAEVYGTSSPHRPTGQGCWPEHHNQIALPFALLPPIFTGTLRIGYIWYSKLPGLVQVRYGSTVQALLVLPGLHSGYLPVSGRPSGIVVEGLADTKMCVGDAEAGNIGPALAGPVIPRTAVPSEP